MESTLREARSQWFVLSDSPGIAYPAERFGDDWNGWVTPVVTAPTLAILLLTVISDPVSTYVAFAIDAAGTCTLQDLSLIHISEPTRRTPISYAVFCLKKK